MIKSEYYIKQTRFLRIFVYMCYDKNIWGGENMARETALLKMTQNMKFHKFQKGWELSVMGIRTLVKVVTFQKEMTSVSGWGIDTGAGRKMRMWILSGQRHSSQPHGLKSIWFKKRFTSECVICNVLMTVFHQLIWVYLLMFGKVVYVSVHWMVYFGVSLFI